MVIEEISMYISKDIFFNEEIKRVNSIEREKGAATHIVKYEQERGSLLKSLDTMRNARWEIPNIL